MNYRFICILIFLSISKQQSDPLAEEEYDHDFQSETITKQDSIKISTPLEQRNCTNLINIALISQEVKVKDSCLFGILESKVPIRIKKALKATTIQAQSLYTPGISVRKIQSHGENQPIIINGSLAIQKMHIKDSNKDIELVLMQKTQRFWQMQHHLTFDDDLDTSECLQISGGRFLGGHCKLERQEVTKHFPGLPLHKQIRVEMNLHMFDDWDQEVVQVLANDIIIYQNRFTNTKYGMNLCGDKHFGDDNINVKIEKIIEHQSSDLILTIKAYTEKHPCKASFGVDNVIIHIR